MWWGGGWVAVFVVGGWVRGWLPSSPAPIFALFSLWGVFSWNFGGVFEGTLNVHVKSSRAVV